MKPIDYMLGRPGEAPQCKIISKTVSVHWYPTGAKAGDRCFCGESVKREDADAA